MGLISDFVASKKIPTTSLEQGIATWQQVFGTTKETGNPPVSRPVPGGTYGRSLAPGDASVKRLLQAMRSMAPGGWSDNRWEQTRHFRSIQYVCFPAGTRVRMADGSYRPIEKIGLRNKVLTAEGNVHRVEHCFVRKYEGDLVNLRLWGHRHLKMTPNHKVLTKRGYVAAEELTGNDWVAVPRYLPHQTTVLQTAGHLLGGWKKKAYRNVPDLIELTPEFGRIVGLYLAEAHTTKNGEITWSFNAAKEKDTLAAEMTTLLEGFGFIPRVTIPKYNHSVVQVHVCGKRWVRLFHSLCGHLAHAKKLHSDLLSGPDDFLKAVLDAWLDGDGCLEKGKYLVGATISHDLALNMFDIGNSLGLRPTILRQESSVESILGRKVNNRPTWKVFFRATSDNYRVQMDDRHVWRKVESLQREPYSGDVYNIEVAEDQSYVAEGIGVHNCIHRAGEQLMGSEFALFRKDPSHPDGKRPVTPDDPPEGNRIVKPYDMIDLLEKPNPDDGYGDLMYQWNLQMDLTGMALTWMVPNQLGVPFELYPVPTAIAIPQPAVNPDFPDGFYRIQPIYPYGPFSSYPTPNSAIGAPIPAQWMLRFKYHHPLLKYDGFSPQTALQFHLDEIEMIDRSRHYSMRRGIHPSAVLNFDEMEGAQPLPEPEIARIKAEFEETQMGPENYGNLFVATPGAKLEEWGNRPVDMEYQSGWMQLVDFAMAGFGTSKAIAGMVGDSSYSTLFASLKQFHLLTLQPKCNRIAAKLTRHLAPFFGDDLILEIRCPRIDDHEVRHVKMQTLMEARAVTKNEMRREFDLPLTDEEWGGELAGVDTRLEKQVERDVAMAQEGEQMGIPPEKATTRKIVAAAEENQQDPDERKATDQMENHRPRAGKVGVGALGPRKFLDRFSTNGNGRHS